MELPLSQAQFCTFLMLAVSNMLLWEKVSSIPACLAEEGGCWNPIVETFNSAMQRGETLRNLADQLYTELYHNQFSSEQFLALNSKLIRRDKTAVRAGTYCHSTLSNSPDGETKHADVETEKYLKMLINFVGAWISPLYHLVIELSAMQDVPETILSKAKDIEENKRELLDDLKWILTKVYPTAEMKEEFPSWEHLSFLKSSNKDSKFLAMFNLSKCIYNETYYILFYLRTLKCHITGKDC
ncbi:prolactin-8A9 isoform X1 [Rattus norvegicus]|uniref:Isoform 3 of Prolactin-8A9 n=1 Tax=Rattus norvegicus TaxID=10116 RepID=Q920I0-3|nr:prolactin-8A9 isoform X1 [Rattus norvegicus]AAO49169.1 prolactin-like protein C beta isoform 1-b precursor [Rattus norvegicus]|eukprot:XP_006253966.1 PREDICTED: prolactin-8A9 isoform X1 [Rattus norvegicus]